MFRSRSVLALGALCLSASVAFAQSATPAVSTVVAFNFSNNVGNLVLGGDGALYGVVNPVTSVTGGLVYRAAADGSDTKTIYQLSPADDGFAPGAGLTLGSDGLLYGTTKFGRTSDLLSSGTIFRVSTSGTGFTVLHRFQPYTTTATDPTLKNEQGVFPEAELTEGSDGYLYGVTSSGGPNGTGTVFKVSKEGTGFQVLHAFAVDTDTTTSGLVVTVDGATPLGQLVQGADGKIYGTTSAGGTNGRGVIFRVGSDGTGFEVLKHFSAVTADATTALLENADGATPLAGLTDGNDGFFYGVTSIGGATGHGVIFSIATDGTYTVLHAFDGTTGQRPLAEMVLGSDGRLYGTTGTGGVTSAGAASALGTLFVIDRAGTNFTRLYSFTTDVGALPSTKLVQQSASVFYGTVASGSSCGYGAIFRYSGTGDTVTGSKNCGNTNNDNNGGGAGGPALVLMLGTLLALRRRTR
jgi:Gloeo_Verruco repeat